MCALCCDDPIVLKRERDGLNLRAQDLRRMARTLEGLASGKVRPHSEDKEPRRLAHSLIRYLVEEWL